MLKGHWEDFGASPHFACYRYSAVARTGWDWGSHLPFDASPGV